MPTYKLQRHTASSYSNSQRDSTSEMNEEPPTRDTSVFDFNEGDLKPSGKKADLFKRVFEHGQTQYGEQGKRRKSLVANSKKKRKLTAKKLPKKKSQRIKTAAEASSNRSSSASDLIEADDSDSESYQDRRILEKRFGGAPGISCFNTCTLEDRAAGQIREVVMHGEELIFSEQCFSCPVFTFTADGIVLKVGSSCMVKWALQELELFRSCFHEEKGLAFIELNLTERGVRTFLQALGQSDNCENYWSCHTLSSSLSSDKFSWDKDVKQINSLSDGYRMKWRPLKEDMNKLVREPLESTTWQREDLEDQHLLADSIACDRDRCRSDDWFDLIFPTKEDHDAVTVTQYDFLLLNPDQFLSDTIIDFYIKYQQSLLSEEQNKRFYFYNSFFFRKLTEEDKTPQQGFEKRKSSFERVKRWTAKINIFEKDYLFIPIMQSAHWSLVIVCHPGSLSAGCQNACDCKVPMIMHFDSLEGCHTFVEEPIRKYLIEAWNEKNGPNDDPQSLSMLKFVAVKAPQQTNYSDCGLFLLHYVELFIQEALNKGSIDFAFDEWFNPAQASSKRGDIRSLIEHLKAKESAEKPGNSCFHTSSNATGPSDEAWLAQRSDLVGEECFEATHLFTGNMLHQGCSMLVSYPLQYQNNQVRAHTKFGHGHLELGLDPEQLLATRESQLCQNQAPTSMQCLFQQGSVIQVQDMAMHNCTHEEKNCVVHDYDQMRLQESLEDTTCHENMEDFYAVERDVGINLADESGEGPENDASRFAMVDENCILIKSDSIENNSPDAWIFFESSLHKDGNRVSDMSTFTVQKLSLEEGPCADANEKGNESPKDGKPYINDDSLAELSSLSPVKVEQSNSEPNEGFFEDLEPKIWLRDSTGYDDDLEGKESSSAAKKSMEDGLMPSEVEAYGGVTTPRETLTERTNPLEAGVVTLSESLKEQTKPSEVGFVTPRESLIERTNPLEVSGISSPVVEERFGLDRPLSLSSDEGLTPNAAEVSKETKRGRRSHKSNSHQVSPATRRVTRNATKRVIDLS